MMSARRLLKSTALLALTPITTNAHEDSSLQPHTAPLEHNVSVSTKFALGDNAQGSLSEHDESTWEVNFDIQVASEQAKLSVQAELLNDAQYRSADPSWPNCLAWTRLPAVSSQDDAAVTCEEQLSAECIAALKEMMSSGELCKNEEDVKQWPQECKDLKGRPLNAFEITTAEGEQGRSVYHDYIRNLETDDLEEEVLDDLAESVWLVALGWQSPDANDEETQQGLVRCARLADDDEYFVERAQDEDEEASDLDDLNEFIGDSLELRDLNKRKGGGHASSGGKSSSSSSKSSSSKSSGKSSKSDSDSDSSSSSSSSSKGSSENSDSSSKSSDKKSKSKVVGGGGSKNKTEKDGAVALGQGGSMGFAAAGVAGFVILLGLL